MAFAPRVETWMILASLVAMSSPSAAEETTAPAHSWQGPATAAAEAAAAQAANQSAAKAANEPAAQAAAKDAIVPPLPKPAERPAAAAAPAPPVKKAEPSPAPAKDAASTKAAAEKADTKSGKAKQKKPTLTAKQLFGTVKAPAPLAARAVGWYSKGCLAGGKPIAVDGPGWQVMRLSRNRNWGHPDLVALVERLARETTAAKEWPGLLVGDMSQPRGGPMVSGHTSHQVGLDADIWLTPMPDRTLTRREREDISAVSTLLNAGQVNPKVWGQGQEKLIRRAAKYSAVERILVHPALKKALCESAGKNDRAWLNKVRPYYGHYYHFHIRIGCPKGSSNCRSQPPVPDGDTCGAELTDWLKRVAPKPTKKPPAVAEKPAAKPSKPAKRKPEITLADLPSDCSTVLTAGGNVPPTEPKEIVDKSKNAAPEKDVTVSTAPPPPPAPESKAPSTKAAN